MSKPELGALGMTNDLLRAGGGQHPVLQSLGVRRGQLGRGLGQAPPGTSLGRTSTTHLGFGLPPHFRLQAGGEAAPGACTGRSGADGHEGSGPPDRGFMTDATSAHSGFQAGGSALTLAEQEVYRQLQSRSLKELQELARRYGTTSPYGRLIQRAIVAKQPHPSSGLGSPPRG
jgi:hypothetical protein